MQRANVAIHDEAARRYLAVSLQIPFSRVYGVATLDRGFTLACPDDLCPRCSTHPVGQTPVQAQSPAPDRKDLSEKRW